MWNGGTCSSETATSHTQSTATAQMDTNDLNAIVFEYGTAKCKVGYAGEDFPHVYESILQAQEQSDHFEMAKESRKLEHNCDAITKYIDSIATTRLQADLHDRPLLWVERPFHVSQEADSGSAQKSEYAMQNEGHIDREESLDRKCHSKDLLRYREEMVETFMEKLELPALFAAKSAVLACYANARTSGLVVELGATYSSISTVQEGYAYRYPRSQHLHFGGFDLDAYLQEQLQEQYAAQMPPSQRKHASWTYLQEVKESSLCHVADAMFDETQNQQLPRIPFELPDKTIVLLGAERFSVAEKYFASVTPAISNSKSHSEWNTKGISIANHIVEVVNHNAETEGRRDLLQNIVLTGGSSCFENFANRLEKEVSNAHLQQVLGVNASVGSASNSFRVRVCAALAQERKIGSFLGGSILGSLGSFHEMWMSKAEYAEHGAALIHKKCP